MNKAELLKAARDILLKLHKSMVDLEREMYEGIHGRQTAGAFLNLLLEDVDMAWLRKFSMLIVEIDEMFDLKEGIAEEDVEANVLKIEELIAMTETDDYFKAKYQFALTRSPHAAMLHVELKQLLASSV